MNILGIVAGNQPISEVVPDADVAFQVGMILGIIIGCTFASVVVGLYNDIKEKKKHRGKHEP